MIALTSEHVMVFVALCLLRLVNEPASINIVTAVSAEHWLATSTVICAVHVAPRVVVEVPAISSAIVRRCISTIVLARKLRDASLLNFPKNFVRKRSNERYCCVRVTPVKSL